jgi:hypothetical protein
MRDRDEFVDRFEPPAPEFWIPLVRKSRADSNPQEQQSKGSQLFHKLDSNPPQRARTRDNFSTGTYLFRENARLQNQRVAIRFLDWKWRIAHFVSSPEAFGSIRGGMEERQRLAGSF